MANYYYLISSLPMLKADGSVAIDYKSFLDMCTTSVSAATFESLKDLFGSNSDNSLLKEWNQFYGQLNDELNYQRKLKLGRPAVAPYNRDSEVVTTVAAAMSAPNPLVSEQMLLDLEFKRIDSLLGLHYFDEYYLFGYAIKLKLLERQRVFVHDDGREEFTRLFNGVKQQILSI